MSCLSGCLTLAIGVDALIRDGWSVVMWFVVVVSATICPFPPPNQGVLLPLDPGIQSVGLLSSF